jgi:hypothetical protein
MHMPGLIYYLIAGCALLAVSCEKKSFYIDTESPEENPAAALIDSITPRMQVESVDSFVTANSGVALAGFHDDPAFGRIMSQPYFRLSLPATTVNIPTNSAFDSIKLILQPNKYYYGDTSQQLKLLVYRLTEKIDKGDRNDFYNTTSFRRETSAIGQFTGLVYPNKPDSIAISISNSWGNELFTKLRDKATEVSSEDNFNNYLHGLTIEPDTTISKNIVGFTASTAQLKMRLYYHVNEAIARNETIDFPLKENTTQFNHTRINRQQSELKAFTHGSMSLSTSSLGNTAYLQPMTGISTLISFPALQSLKEQGRFVSVLKATLIVRPVRASYVNYALPGKLVLKEQDQYGRLSSELTDASGLSIQYGDLQTDDVYHQNTFYQYDLTGYVRQQLAASVYETTSLLLQPPAEALNTQFTRLVFGDKKHGYRLELKLYLLMYK